MEKANWLQLRLRVCSWGVTAVCACLAACASTDQGKLTDAATAPLADFNLVQAEIPSVLLQAQKQPYAVPADLGCVALKAEIADLDAVLGADLDAPPSDDKPGGLQSEVQHLG